MSNRYIAVTIGPIFDTVNLASSPAALWTGSYMFSYLSKTICKLLVERGIPENDIVSPYYTCGTDFPTDCDGVGLYHDRIVFRSEKFTLREFDEVKEKAVESLAETFAMDATFLKEYVMIYAAAFSVGKHPVLETSQYLDGMELARPFANGQTGNELLSVLVGEKYYGNENIKGLPLVKNFRNWQLWKDGCHTALKSLSEIARSVPKSDMKKHSYYAVVRSDGDRMNQVLQNQVGDEAIREFSKQCIFYCADIAELVRQFGGVAIYSGGDDLLAILPCESAGGESIFQFLQKCNEKFAEFFGNFKPQPTLSFGVTICYHKFPLYEALEDSQHMLFNIAKKKRDCTAIHLQKHAGQSEGLLIPNKDLKTVTNFLKDHIMATDSDWIHSIHHKLYTFRHLFVNAGKNTAIAKNLLANTFDADSHRNNSFVEKYLPEFYGKLQSEMNIEVIGNTKEKDIVDAMCYLLRIFKFFVEKGGEKA